MKVKDKKEQIITKPFPKFYTIRWTNIYMIDDNRSDESPQKEFRFLY